MTQETERAIRAFAYYFEINQKETEFWIKQWRLGSSTKIKPPNKYPDEKDTTNEKR